MKAVITGDIINSRQVSSSKWIKSLRCLGQGFGPDPQVWEIYRGDSFLLMTNDTDALISLD